MSRASRARDLSSCTPLVPPHFFLSFLLYSLDTFLWLFFFFFFFFFFLFHGGSEKFYYGRCWWTENGAGAVPAGSKENAGRLTFAARCPVSRLLDSRTQQAVEKFRHVGHAYRPRLIQGPGMKVMPAFVSSNWPFFTPFTAAKSICNAAREKRGKIHIQLIFQE